MIKLKKNYRFINFLIIFIFIDILLLPNFPFFSMPISLPLVIGLIIFKKIKIKFDREVLVFIILSLLILLSVVLSFLQSPQSLGYLNVWMENIKRAFQLITSFSYYFLFKNYLKYTSINIKKILYIFIVMYIGLGIIANLNVGLYFTILNTIGVKNPFASDWFLIQQEELFRYSYLFVDPNNAAYIFQLIVFYILLNETLKPIEKIFLYISLLISLILSMSTGAVISAIVFFAFFVLFTFLKFIRENKFRTSYENILKQTTLYGFGILTVGIVAYFLRDMYSNITEYSIDRMSGNTDGGRLEIYRFMLANKIPNLIGEGYVQIRNGSFFRPHSDHLRFLYSYGIVAYLISLWFFFRKAIFNSKFLFVIPGFMAYSINTLIDEQKILIILLLLVSYTQYLNKVVKVDRNSK